MIIMVLDWLKEKLPRFGRREPDYEDIKEHILRPSVTSTGPRPSLEPSPNELTYEFEKPNLEGLRPEPRFERSKEFRPEFERFGDELSREPLSIPAHDEKRSLDRIEDMLMFIKEQLTAIKAQNEAISERLKNIERVTLRE